jgi:hypothetical protein
MVDNALTEVIPTTLLRSFPVFAKEPHDERGTRIFLRGCQYGIFISYCGNIADSGGRTV